MTDDIRRLLGGYATGTLTQAERQALFEASLQDQQLFEALADEEALRELLEDSAARAALLQATETVRFSMGSALREWFERPKAKVLVATGCVLLVAIGYRALTERPETQRGQQEIAAIRAPQQQTPAPVPVAPAESTPVPEQARSQPRRAAKLPDETAAVPLAAPPAVSDVPAPATPAARVADSSAAPVHYTVLRRAESGEYVPVPDDYLLGPNDRVRLRVEANERGMLTVSSEDRATLFAGNISPGAAVVVPEDISMEGRAVRVLELRFAPLPAMLMAEEGPASSSFRSGARLMSSARQSGEKQETAQQKLSAPAQTALTLQVVLRRKP